MLVGSLVRAFHWMIGPSLKIFLNKEKFVDIKFKMEGPTFIIPEGRENPQVIAISLGKIMMHYDALTEQLSNFRKDSPGEPPDKGWKGSESDAGAPARTNLFWIHGNQPEPGADEGYHGRPEL